MVLRKRLLSFNNKVLELLAPPLFWVSKCSNSWRKISSIENPDFQQIKYIKLKEELLIYTCKFYSSLLHSVNKGSKSCEAYLYLLLIIYTPNKKCIAIRLVLSFFNLSLPRILQHHTRYDKGKNPPYNNSCLTGVCGEREKFNISIAYSFVRFYLLFDAISPFCYIYIVQGIYVYCVVIRLFNKRKKIESLTSYEKNWF